MNLKKLLISTFLTFSFVNCPGGGSGGSDTTNLLFLLAAGGFLNPATNGPCMQKNSSTITSSVGTFTGPGGNTYYYSNPQDYVLGQSKPSAIFHVQQDHGFTNRPVFPTFYDGSNQNYIGREGWNIISTTSMSPYGQNGIYYIGTFVNNLSSTGTTYGVDFNFPVSPAVTNAQASIVTNCRTLDTDEKSFSPDSGFSSSTNGLSRVWTNRKKLNVNLIFVKNGNTPAYPDPTIEGLQAALDRWSSIYSQDSVKIDIQFTAQELDSANFLSIASLSTDDYGATSSLGRMYSSTGSYQSETALNLYITREETQVGGVLGVSGGIPGTIGLTGTPQSGMVVFIEAHRSSGAVGSALSNADLTFLGDTMAHEAGHFLGLFHTNESAGASGSGTPNMSKDPLIETPQCDSTQDTAPADGQVSIVECNNTGFFNSGALNLMFWAGDGVTAQTKLTGEQGWVLRLNPLVY
ncbi:M43 family zinc metalloprotease [Leptospira ellisii]|uniref:M43 family zinc metalloprotease n=1 Tax=Leptospira ellisii TaxID=2023197 RepID=UPI000C29AB0A|nr:M43 family zinc metalloprotease [Leptospira ellisii]PKA06230.1 hypothetical protein CH375_00710 [Leptospira ellisii]